jgi:hypothetical protein
VAPPITTAAEVVFALQTAVTRIPGIRIHAREHCLGHDWWVNPDRLEVHINGQLTPLEYGGALAEALAELERHIATTPIAGRIPAPIDELAARRGWLRTS